jgi:hypothetical protein
MPKNVDVRIGLDSVYCLPGILVCCRSESDVVSIGMAIPVFVCAGSAIGFSSDGRTEDVRAIVERRDDDDLPIPCRCDNVRSCRSAVHTIAKRKIEYLHEEPLRLQLPTLLTTSSIIEFGEYNGPSV